MPINGSSYTLTGLRGLRTRKRNAVTTILKKPVTPDQAEAAKPTDPEGLSAEEKISLVCDLLEEVQDFDRAILGHTTLPPGHLDTELDGVEEFENPVRVEVARLRTAVQQAARANASQTFYSAQQATPMRRVTFGTSADFLKSTPYDFSSSTDTAELSPQVSYRPPKELDIAPEKFSGERLKFQQFRTQFELWVSRQPRSTPRERLMVLKKYVTGDPKALIDPLELTDANYAVAWALLESCRR